MRNRRFALCLVLIILVLTLVACAKPLDDASNGTLDTEKQKLASEPPVPLAANTGKPLHFYDESAQIGAYVREDYSEYAYEVTLMNGHLSDGTMVGMCGKNINEEYLVQAKDGDLTQLTRIPGYDWLQTDKYCREHYKGDFRLMDSGELVIFFQNDGWDSTQDYIAEGSSSLVVGDADGFEMVLTAENDLQDDIRYITFDPVHQERCVIFSCKEDNTDHIITFYNWKTREVIHTESLDRYHLFGNTDSVVLGDVFYTVHRSHPHIYCWDMNTGEELEPFEFDIEANTRIRDAYPSYAVCGTNDGKGLLLVDGRGIFYLDPKQDYKEMLIIPGKNQPFSAPSMHIDGIWQLVDGGIMVKCWDMSTGINSTQGIRVLRYTYDPEYDRRASSLEVYSLERNATLAQAVTVYTDKNPDADIEYVVGTEGGLSSADALTALTTRILAGNGPDVLVMDGLPLDSYVEKGALADISELLPPDDECYSGVVNAYKQPDGKVYAAPARFSVPTLLGKNVAGVKSLQDLAAWANKYDKKDFGVGSRGAMHSFFPFYAKDWIVNGQFQAEVFRADLETMGVISEQWRATTSKPIDRYQYGGDVSFQAYNWYAGDQCGAFGESISMDGLMHVYSAIREKGGELVPYGDGMFIPSTIVAQSASSRNPQEARALIQTLLGEDVQSAQLNDGFSILRPVVEAQKESPFGEDYENEMKISWISGMPEVTLVERWPKAKDLDAFVAILDTLTVPANVDYTLRDLFIEETLPYLLGEETIDSCMQHLTSKLSIYLAE